MIGIRIQTAIVTHTKIIKLEKKMIKITLSQKEVDDIPNDADLGKFVRNKLYQSVPKEFLQEELDPKIVTKVLNKLRQPCHRDFLTKSLRLTPDKMNLIITHLQKEGLIWEVPQAKDFWTTKKN